jgi:hypothetical protein
MRSSIKMDRDLFMDLDAMQNHVMQCAVCIDNISVFLYIKNRKN